MTPKTTFEIAVLPGDGIGVEVTAAAVEVLDALSAEIGGIRFNWRHYPGGAQTFRDTGVALAEETLKALEHADAILFGAMGLPDIRYPDGTEIAPQLDIRMSLDLKATLEKAQKRFAALAKVEERHANHYKAQLAKVTA